MKCIETQATIDQFLKSVPESVQETICGGGDRPAGGGGGGDIIVFDVIDSVAAGGSGLVAPVKIKHGL